MRGPGNHAGVDRFHQRDVGEAGGADVAHRGEPGVERAPRVARAAQRGVGRQLAHRPRHPVALDVIRQVRVRVDQARQQRDVAEVDRLRAGRRIAADAGDLSVLNDDRPPAFGSGRRRRRASARRGRRWTVPAAPQASSRRAETSRSVKSAEMRVMWMSMVTAAASRRRLVGKSASPQAARPSRYPQSDPARLATPRAKPAVDNLRKLMTGSPATSFVCFAR